MSDNNMININDKIKTVLEKRSEIQNELNTYESNFETTLDIVDGIGSTNTIHKVESNKDIYDTFTSYVSNKYLLEEKLAVADMIIEILKKDDVGVNKYFDEAFHRINENYHNLIQIKETLTYIQDDTDNLKIKKDELLQKLQNIFPN